MDGMDVVAVAEATERAIKIVREEVRPYFLEFHTYRFRAHSMFDPELYRDKKEVEGWKQRDPIPALIQRMEEQSLLNEGELKEMEKKVADEVAEAVAFAEAGSGERVDAMLKDVYARRS